MPLRNVRKADCMSVQRKKKHIWIFHHYATPPNMSGLTRAYDFSKQLIKGGYKCTVFSSAYLHYSGKNVINDKSLLKGIAYNNVSFIFIKTLQYKNSKTLRILNMLSYYYNLFKAAKKVDVKCGKPDVIIGSSAHPLAALAAIKLGKQYGCQAIVEVRDLWPESFVAYDVCKKNNPLLRLFYASERWLYKKADKLIFTMEGGRDYIIEKGWDLGNGGPIDINKVHHINNGVDLISHDYNVIHNPYTDKDLDNPDIFKVVYAGSIRKANNVGLLVDAAEYIQQRGVKNVKLFIFGDGGERARLKLACIEKGIKNVVFKGRVDKKFIPSILNKSNLNILNYSSHAIWKYGGSQNKLFEYLASGKPVLSTISMGYDIISKYDAGVSLDTQSPASIGEAIINIMELDCDRVQEMSANARKAATEYDFKVLTNKLIDIIEGK